jgi:hypothetical protein
MTRAEYLEFVQESLAFPPLGDAADTTMHDNAGMTLRDTPEVCKRLARVHHLYCLEVEKILFPERRDKIKEDMKGSVRLWQVEDQLAGGNVGHGHVTPRPDGVCARCGGPGLCPVCSQEQAQKNKGLITGEAQDAEDDKLTVYQLREKYGNYGL